MARVRNQDKVWASDKQKMQQLKRWFLSTRFSADRAVGEFRKQGGSPNQFIGFTDKLPDIPKNIEKDLKKISPFDVDGKAKLPNKFPINPEIASKLYFYLEQYHNRKSSFRPPGLKPDEDFIAQIYVTSERTWYGMNQNLQFRKMKKLPILPKHAVGQVSSTIIASDGNYQWRQDFPLDVKYQIESLFERTFAVTSELKFANRNIDLGMFEDPDGNHRFFIDFKENSEQSYESAKQTRELQAFLDRLDQILVNS